MKGKMIVFDGSNGAGKSTQIKIARELLECQGYEVIVTREPGGTPVAEQIRDILLSTQDSADSLTLTTETLLFFAARAQHVEKRIIPALEQGKIVLCDRFTSSTIAFQCYAQDFPLERMREIESATLCDFRPDLTLIFDIDTEEGLRRTGAVGDEDRIETIGLANLERARQGFLWQAAEEPWRFAVVPASGGIHEVATSVESHILRLMDPDNGILPDE